MTNERKVIYLDDALGILDDLQRGYENGFNIYADSRKQMLDLSFAQPERKKGEWIGGELGNCSVCGHYGCASDIWDGCEGKYCPNCGADLRGEADDK